MLAFLFQCVCHNIFLNTDTKQIEVYRTISTKNEKILELYKVFNKVHKDYLKMPVMSEEDIVRAIKNNYEYTEDVIKARRDIVFTYIKNYRGTEFNNVKITNSKLTSILLEGLYANKIKASNIDTDYPLISASMVSGLDSDRLNYALDNIEVHYERLKNF
ncbi:hypothetical protein D3C81_07490 [compost metagenome]